MKNKRILILTAVIVIAAAGIYVYSRGQRQALAPQGQNNSRQQDLSNNNQDQSASNPNLADSSTPQSDASGGQNPGVTSSSTAQSQGTFSSGEGDMGPDVLVVQVNFDGTSFSPNTVNIKAGDIVVFKNNSQQDFWPASNPHPIHTDYPEFDAKKNIPPGGKYQFQFEKVGTWGYHDHLNPSITGTIVVSAK
jgi:plastocyanin